MATMSATMKQFTKGLKTSLEPMQASLANIEKCSCLVSSRESIVEEGRLEKDKLDQEKEQTAALKKIAADSSKNTKDKDKEKDKGFLEKHWGKILIGGILAATLLPKFETLKFIGETVRTIEKMIKFLLHGPDKSGMEKMVETSTPLARITSTVKPRAAAPTSFKPITQKPLITPTKPAKIIPIKSIPKTPPKTPTFSSFANTELFKAPANEVHSKKIIGLRSPLATPPPSESFRGGFKTPKAAIVETGKTNKSGLGKNRIDSLLKQRQNFGKKILNKAMKIRTAASIAFAAAGPYAAAGTAVLLTALEVWAESETGKETLAIWGVERDEVINHIVTKGKLAKSFTVNQRKADDKEYHKQVQKRLTTDQQLRLGLDPRTKSTQTGKEFSINHPLIKGKLKHYFKKPVTPRPVPSGEGIPSPVPSGEGISIVTQSRSKGFPKIKSKIDWSVIQGVGSQEGFRLTGYVPGKGKGKFANSGVTIASGVDLGQWNEAMFEKFKDKGLVAKLKPFLGKTGTTANNIAKNLTVTKSQALALDAYAREYTVNQLQNVYGPAWENFSQGQQTAAASVAYQYGAHGTPTFSGHMKNRNFISAVGELKNKKAWKSFFPERADQNAELILRSILPGVRPDSIIQSMNNLHNNRPIANNEGFLDKVMNFFKGGDDNSSSTTVSMPGSFSSQDKAWERLVGTLQ